MKKTANVYLFFIFNLLLDGGKGHHGMSLTRAAVSEIVDQCDRSDITDITATPTSGGGLRIMTVTNSIRQLEEGKRRKREGG